MSNTSFAVTAGDPRSPVILHVPHSATDIPARVRAGIVLPDDELTAELAHMTDAHTERIAVAAAEQVPVRPWLFVNRLSRLVIDPERFPDDREEMLAVGMGAVYTCTSGRQVLRKDDPARDEELLTAYFHPYSDAFAALVDERLAALGRAVVIDVHSYPREALPYELHGEAARPAVCLGADHAHTPPGLVELATWAFERVGDVRVNEPFAGTYVPLRHYEADPRVESLMVEIRRDTYMTEPGGLPTPGLDVVTDALRELLAGLHPGRDDERP